MEGSGGIRWFTLVLSVVSILSSLDPGKYFLPPSVSRSPNVLFPRFLVCLRCCCCSVKPSVGFIGATTGNPLSEGILFWRLEEGHFIAFDLRINGISL